MEAAKMKKSNGILFESIPDSGQAHVYVGEDGSPNFVCPNLTVIPIDILMKLENLSGFLYPPPKPIVRTNTNYIINLCADADEYHRALTMLDQIAGDKVPIFNHPRSVLMSRRDLSSKLLNGIPNLIVPKCVRFKANGHDIFPKIFEEKGFTYPVLIRPQASQTGRGLVKIEHALDWTKICQAYSHEKYHYMTQFHDFKNENGSYVKIRIAVIGDQISLRAYGEDTQWRLGHPGIRQQKTSTSEMWKNLVQQYDNFHLWNSAKDVGHEIRKRSKLDFFGIDLGVIDHNNFVLFEANAAMTMAKMANFEPEDRKIAEKIFSNIEDSLLKLISKPEKWSNAKTFPTYQSILGMS